MTPFKIIYWKYCHLLVELVHKAYWAIKALNLDYWAAGKKRKLQLSELEELRLDAYENAKLYKERTKRWTNRRILKSEFKEGELVLLFNSRLKLFLGKLQSRWSRPFMVNRVTLYEAIEIWSESTSSFTVNDKRLKHYVANNLVEE